MIKDGRHYVEYRFKNPLTSKRMDRFGQALSIKGITSYSLTNKYIYVEEKDKDALEAILNWQNILLDEEFHPTGHRLLGGGYSF